MLTRSRWLCLALAAAALAACSAQESRPTDPPSESASSESTSSGTASASPTPEPVAVRGIVPALPDGTFGVLGTVTGKTDPSALGESGVVFTATRIVAVTDAREVIAVDRATGALAWRAALPGPASDTTCTPVTPPPDATVVTVLIGYNCERTVGLDLETGAQLFDETHEQLGNGRAQVGPYTFVIGDDGTLFRFDPAGALVNAGGGVPVDGQVVEGILGGPDSKQLVVKTMRELELGDPGAITRTDDGEFIGLQVLDDGRTQEAWRVTAKDVLGRVIRDSTFLGAVDRGYDGSVLNAVGSRADPDFRLARFDLETGAMDKQVTVTDDTPGGVPAWAESFSSDSEMLVVGNQVYASSTSREGPSQLTRYDLDAGTVPWSWRPPKGRSLTPFVAPVAASDDGQHVYATVRDTFTRTTLVELDTASGTPGREWVLPQRLTKRMYTIDFYLDGDTVVAFDSRSTSAETRRSPVLAVLAIEPA